MSKSIPQRMRRSLQLTSRIWRLHGAHTGFLSLVAKMPLVSTLVRYVCGGRLLVRARVHGQTMWVNVFDPGIAWQLLSRGTREDAHVAQIQHALRPGDNGIELGANIGFFTLIEAPATAPTGKIWCVEPVSANVALLRRNIRANGFQDRAKVSQYLVGDRNGMGSIQLAAASNSHTVSRQQPTSGSETVPMVTLDAFMQEKGITTAHIQFMRMDIEGYEVLALDGMRALMEASTPLKFFIEFHPQSYPEWGWTFERFLRRLTGHGFRIRQTAKERERGPDGRETTIILNDPSVDELVAAAQHWRPGGIQAHLERS